MEPTRLIDDAEFWLPTEFLSDEDFLVEKENKSGGIHDSNEPRYGFETNSTVKPKSHEDDFLAGLTKQMVLSTLEDDISGGFCGNHMACGETRSPQSTLCGTEIGCDCRYQRSNLNFQTRVSSQTWDLYRAAAEEVVRMNITNEPYDFNKGFLDIPRKHSVSASKNPNNGYFNNQSLQYQKLQAIQFQQLKQQQLLKHHRQMMQQNRRTIVNTNKNGGPWSNQFPRVDNSGMRAVFLRDHTRKRSSTGTGVFLPRRVDHNSQTTTETREKHNISTVLVPARVAQVLNLNLDESIVRSPGNLNGNSVKAEEQPVNELRLPSDWAY